VLALDIVVVLNTEDGTGIVEVLETLEGGVEIGCDLGVDV